jgi:2-hydroxycyclohexanecarboxyl-CoA dehydrogenase
MRMRDIKPHEERTMSLQDKVAVVTGAASGIGRATAEALAAEGARVIVADIDREGGEKTVATLRERGADAEFLAVDMTDAASIAAFADAVNAKYGAVDVLVNGAGWGRTHPFWEGTPELWNKLIALNLVGPMTLAKALLPPMLERKRGRIVNIASDAGRVGSLGETVYAGAKGGLIAFTKSLARETARHGINVNCVCPGPTETPLLAAVPEAHLEAFKKAIPLRRFAQPSEVADAVAFFAGAQSNYVTGQVLSVSGGLTMVG